MSYCRLKSRIRDLKSIESSAFRVLHIYQACILIKLTVFELFICPLVVTILNRIFFVKRTAGPVGRKQYAPQIRVTIELDSELMVYSALHPVCACPHRSNAWPSFAVGKSNL